MELVLGMAKGRTTFRTENGKGGAGKRTNSELDLLRLVRAVSALSAEGHRVHAYFSVLRSSDGETTRRSLESWLIKYRAKGVVEIVERQLTPEESVDLDAEKTDRERCGAGTEGW